MKACGYDLNLSVVEERVYESIEEMSARFRSTGPQWYSEAYVGISVFIFLLLLFIYLVENVI